MVNWLMSKHRKKVGKRTRQAVLQSRGGRCAQCKSRDNLTIDHIKPLSQGGRNIKSNMQPLCYWCNQSKGSKVADYRHG